MNANIIEQFDLLIKQMNAEYLNAEVEGDTKEMVRHRFRIQQTKKALSIIKKIDFKIEDADDLTGFQGIGPGTIKRIKEILETSHLSELKAKYSVKKQKKIDSIQELTKIIGVGDKLAKKLVVDHKIKSINDLKKAIKNKKIEVNDKIKLGLKYYGIVKGNIPREEIKDTEKMLRKEAHILDSDLNIIICGSYRRQKPTSNDIDMLIYHPKVLSMKDIIGVSKSKDKKSYLEMFVDKLTEMGYLTDHMTDKNYRMKYMGFFQYKNYEVRRLDIRLVPYPSLPTAMLYYTGPFELNTYMRKEAIKRHMLLNEYGLYKVDSNDIRTPIKITSEADVFDKLGLDYLTPKQREKFSAGKLKKVD